MILLALLTLVVSYNQAARQVAKDADRAIQTYLELAEELEGCAAENVPAIILRYEIEHPQWRFVWVDDRQVKQASLELSDRQRQMLAQLPPAMHSAVGRDGLLLAAENTWFYVSPVAVDGWPEDSFVICLEPHHAIASKVTQAFGLSGSVALAVAALLVLGGWYYSRRLVKRVVNVQQQVRRIADGNLETIADERGADELSELARSVNELAASLATMKRLIQDAERSRLHTQLAGGLAHELRNGIHAVRLSLDVFLEANLDSALQAASMVENARDQLTMTETLVRRLLAVGKQHDCTVAPRPMMQIIQDVVSMVAPVARHAEITFATEIGADLPDLIEDSESMQSAVLNLCLNGIEAAGRYGHVELSARLVDDSTELTVRDSGPGPHPSIADTLFEPFMTTKPEGIGLGLVLVRQTVSEVDGTVDWKRAGGMTCFTIRIPRGASAAVAKPDKKPRFV